jgi:hypothetical protein
MCWSELHWKMGESKWICNLHWMLELKIKSKYQFLSFINIIMVVSILQHFCLGVYTTTIHCNSKFPTFPYGVSYIHDYTPCVPLVPIYILLCAWTYFKVFWVCFMLATYRSLCVINLLVIVLWGFFLLSWVCCAHLCLCKIGV